MDKLLAGGKSMVQERIAVAVPTTGAIASSMVQLGALLMLGGLGWTGAVIRRRRRTLRYMR